MSLCGVERPGCVQVKAMENRSRRTKYGRKLGRRRRSRRQERDRGNASSCRTATTDSRRGDEEETLLREWVWCCPRVFNWAESSCVQSLIESGSLSCRQEFQALIGQARSDSNNQQCIFSVPWAIHITIFHSTNYRPHGELR